MNKRIRLEKGITLIALIITIIVLLILAGITINTLFGENGILNNASNAKLKTEISTVKENAILMLNEYQINKNADGTTVDAIEYLQGKSTSTTETKKFMTLYEDAGEYTYLVDYKVALPQGTTGRGNEVKKDQYLIEKETEVKYVLSYYNEKSKKTEMLYIYTNGTTEEPVSGNEETEKVDLPIQYIEDLVQLSIDVNSGNDYSGKIIKVTRNLDFNEEASYKNYNENTFNIDFDGDGEIEGIKAELTNLADSSQGMPQIGNTETTPFRGTFDGSNFTLSNINLGKIGYVGLFGYNEGTIKNYTINNVNFLNGEQIGLFVGNNKNEIINLTVIGQITCDSITVPFAGIVCYNTGNVTDCVFGKEGVVQSISSSNIIAGIAYENKGDITNCINYNNLTGETYAGGIIFNNYNAVSNCSNYGKITSGDTAGGIVAIVTYQDPTQPIITGCINGNSGSENTITGALNSGGIVGQNTSSYITIKDCENNMNVSSNSDSSYERYAAGIITSNGLDTIIVEDCINTGTISASPSQTSSGKGASGIVTFKINGYESDTQIPLVSCNIVTISRCENTGNIEKATCCGGIINGCKASFTIDNCINKGTLDSLSAGGGIAGYLYYTSSGTGTVSNCKNLNTISGVYKVGGIVGWATCVTIENCENGTVETCNVENKEIYSTGNYAGGILGYSVNSGVKNSKNYLRVRSNYSAWLGGIIGISSAGQLTVSNCSNYGIVDDGSINGASYGAGRIGGIVGSLKESGSISGCNNYGSINGYKQVGGIVGVLENGSCTIENCSNKGNMAVTDYGMGGIVGDVKRRILLY